MSVAVTNPQQLSCRIQKYLEVKEQGKNTLWFFKKAGNGKCAKLGGIVCVFAIILFCH